MRLLKASKGFLCLSSLGVACSLSLFPVDSKCLFNGRHQHFQVIACEIEWVVILESDPPPSVCLTDKEAGNCQEVSRVAAVLPCLSLGAIDADIWTACAVIHHMQVGAIV